MAEFINPYTFVPLPNKIGRSEPAGHDCAADAAICGSMTVTWTLRTPLLLPKEFADKPSGNHHGSEQEQANDKDRPEASKWVHEGKLVVPGSSLKGTVRSLHETLMGGCLRVFDETFLPVYRQPAVAKSAEWRLGVVSAATRHGRPTRIRMADTTAWAPVQTLTRALARVPMTGDTVTIPAEAIREDTGLERSEVTTDATVSAADAAGTAPNGHRWVIVVGDSGTRQNPKKRRDGTERRFLCAVGRLAGSAVGEAGTIEVADEAWEEYVRLCEGTDDMRRIRQDPESPDIKGWRTGRNFREVTFQGRVVGKRRMVTGRLWPGDVVWARVDESSGKVDRLSMAAIWRVSGRWPMAERIPPALHACNKWKELCISCRMFGSADTTGSRGDDGADQQAYAGHVRFGAAEAVRPARSQVRLAPLSAPRPGSGQFYLQHEGGTEPATNETQLPSAYWGAERYERQGPRPVRGRKHYWHGDPTIQRPPRHKARQNQRNDAMSEQRMLVAAGTVLTQKITFDNLSAAEFGSLMLTLCPDLDLPGDAPIGNSAAAKIPMEETTTGGAVHALHVGGGKPLGLGSATVAITELRWSYVRDRYAGREATVQPVEEFFATVRAQVRALAGPARRYWPTLSRILRVNAVDPALIWYPLGGEWDDETNRDRAFRYFARTNGQFYRNRREPIVTLPDPASGNDQTLPTVQRPKDRR